MFVRKRLGFQVWPHTIQIKWVDSNKQTNKTKISSLNIKERWRDGGYANGSLATFNQLTWWPGACWQNCETRTKWQKKKKKKKKRETGRKEERKREEENSWREKERRKKLEWNNQKKKQEAVSTYTHTHTHSLTHTLAFSLTHTHTHARIHTRNIDQSINP